jgi:hypothetical protein
LGSPYRLLGQKLARGWIAVLGKVKYSLDKVCFSEECCSCCLRLVKLLCNRVGCVNFFEVRGLGDVRRFALPSTWGNVQGRELQEC